MFMCMYMHYTVKISLMFLGMVENAGCGMQNAGSVESDG